MLRFIRAYCAASIPVLLFISGCESAPQSAQSIAPSAYLLGSLPATAAAGDVHVTPVGLRAHRDQSDGTTVILLDLLMQGPEPLVSETSNALQYRFFFDAPEYVAIRSQRGGSSIHLDRDLYADRQDNSFVQFDENVFYKQTVNDRTFVVQPYRVNVARLPRTGNYTVQLNGDALAKALTSIDRKFKTVVFDAAPQEIELTYAQLTD